MGYWVGGRCVGDGIGGSVVGLRVGEWVDRRVGGLTGG